MSSGIIGVPDPERSAARELARLKATVGRALYKEGKFEEALKLLGEVLEDPDSNDKLRLNTAKFLANLGVKMASTQPPAKKTEVHQHFTAQSILALVQQAERPALAEVVDVEIQPPVED